MTRYEVNKKIRLILEILTVEIGPAIDYTSQSITNYEKGIGSVKFQAKIEWYLDKRIDECADPDLKDICMRLKELRHHQ